MKKFYVRLVVLFLLVACGLPGQMRVLDEAIEIEPVELPTRQQVEDAGPEAMELVNREMTRVGGNPWRIKNILLHNHDLFVDVQSRDLGNVSFRFTWSGERFEFIQADHYFVLPGVKKVDFTNVPPENEA